MCAVKREAVTVTCAWLGSSCKSEMAEDCDVARSMLT